MKKRLENLTGVVLKQIARDIKLPGYSKLNTDELREALATELKKADYKDFDLSKYEPAPTPSEETDDLTEKSGESEAETFVGKKVPMFPRRSCNPKVYGRR